MNMKVFWRECAPNVAWDTLTLKILLTTRTSNVTRRLALYLVALVRSNSLLPPHPGPEPEESPPAKHFPLCPQRHTHSQTRTHRSCLRSPAHSPRTTGSVNPGGPPELCQLTISRTTRPSQEPS